MKKEGKRKELFSFNLPLKNRKGLSAIVATLIIILLVLVAAGIIWVVVRNILTEGAGGIELGRFTLDLSIKSAYIDGTNVKVLVRRSSGEGDLIGVKFIFFNGTDSIIVNRNIPLIQTQERLFSFDSSEVGDINALQEVSVAPIYESSSGTETVGDITDTVTISSSPPPGGNGGNGVNGNGDNGNGNGEPPGPVCTTDDDCLEGWICSIDNECVAEIPEECGPENPCPDGYDCIDGACVCTAICDTFGYQCGIASICGEQVDCGECGFGEYCSLYMCIEDTLINSGVVQYVFTSTEPFQFSSASLPYWAELNLQNKYVNFTGLTGVCARIDFHHRVDNIDYVRLDQIVSGLTSGLNYDVWNNTQCGN